MQNDTTETAGVAVVQDFPTAPTSANLTLAQLADAYMAVFAGRDPSRLMTLPFGCASWDVTAVLEPSATK